MKKVVKILILIVAIVSMLVFVGIIVNTVFKEVSEKYDKGYLASDNFKIDIYEQIKNDKNISYKKVKEEARGKEIIIYDKDYNYKNMNLKKIKLNGKMYYVEKDFVTTNQNEIIKEKDMYVRTNCILYNKADDLSIAQSLKKGTKLEILGYYNLKDDGTVEKYKVKYNEKEGYVYSKYLVKTIVEANENYNKNGIYDIHKTRDNKYGGGSAANLDYFPEEKIKIKGNDMPKETRTIYINATALKNIEDYITFAKENNINAMVIDIKEDTVPAYKSNVLSSLSPTNYKKAIYTIEEYKSYIKMVKNAGIYVIGRISTFKDQYYAVDHPENTIIDNRTGKPFIHNSSYWPTAYSRDVWEYNVRLAVEAVKEFGFNEIQFDYVRFPDRVTSLETSGIMNLKNTYNEDKASAIQQFLMYARDELHKAHAYISSDVFGETASSYVTAYGQYWPAISNVVDVISAMPYPDHFNTYEYGFKVPVWTIPYDLMKTWGSNANERQNETPSKAVVRTWIQAYNTIKEPYVVYDATKISNQIEGLYESGLTGGYITWNSGSSMSKYKQLAPAFRKDYLNG